MQDHFETVQHYDILTKNSILDFLDEDETKEGILCTSLLLISKSIQRKRYNFDSLRKILSNAVPHTFIKKILTSKQYNDRSDNKYRVAALSVLCFLCEDAKFALHPKMAAFQDIFKEYIEKDSKQNVDYMNYCILLILSHNLDNSLASTLTSLLDKNLDNKPFPVCEISEIIWSLQLQNIVRFQQLYSHLLTKVLTYIDSEFKTFQGFVYTNNGRLIDMALDILTMSLETQKSSPIVEKIFDCLYKFTKKRKLMSFFYCKLPHLVKICSTFVYMRLMIVELIGNLALRDTSYLWLNFTSEMIEIFHIITLCVKESSGDERATLFENLVNLTEFESESRVSQIQFVDSPILKDLNSILCVKLSSEERFVVLRVILTLHMNFDLSWVTSSDTKSIRSFFDKLLFYATMEIRISLRARNEAIFKVDRGNIAVCIEIIIFINEHILVNFENNDTEKHFPIHSIEIVVTIMTETIEHFFKCFNSLKHSRDKSASDHLFNLWISYFTAWNLLMPPRFLQHVSKTSAKNVPKMFALFRRCIRHNSEMCSNFESEVYVPLLSSALEKVSVLPEAPEGDYAKIIAEHFTKVFYAATKLNVTELDLTLEQSSQALHCMLDKRGIYLLKEKPLFNGLATIFEVCSRMRQCVNSYFLASLGVKYLLANDLEITDSNRQTMHVFLTWILQILEGTLRLKLVKNKYHLTVVEKYEKLWCKLREHWEKCFLGIFSELTSRDWISKYLLECGWIEKLLECLKIVDKTGLNTPSDANLDFAFCKLFDRSKYPHKFYKLFLRCGATVILKKFSFPHTSKAFNELRKLSLKSQFNR